jgi:hypothetical protein
MTRDNSLLDPEIDEAAQLTEGLRSSQTRFL